MFSTKRFLLFLFFAGGGLVAMADPLLSQQSNPVALSIGLFNQDTPKEVEEYGSYYNLSEVGHSDKECVFSTADGSKLSFLFGEEAEKRVELTTKLSRKEVTNLLEKYQFEKMKSDDIPVKYHGMQVYEKKGSSFSSVRTVCVVANSSPITLTFLKDKK